jgi:hypothetical protein
MCHHQCVMVHSTIICEANVHQVVNKVDIRVCVYIFYRKANIVQCLFVNFLNAYSKDNCVENVPTNHGTAKLVFHLIGQCIKKNTLGDIP